MPSMSREAGSKLRAIREKLGIPTTQVEEISDRIAEQEKNREFRISTARLSQIENEGSVPSIFKLYSFSVVYRVRFTDLLRHFGLDLGRVPAHLRLCPPLETQPAEVELPEANSIITFPVRFDPSFDRQATQFLNQVVEVWGEIPLALLERLNPRRRLYAYVGLSDRRMSPLIRPGSFVVIDDQQIEVLQTGWAHEFDRPIYLVELRQGYRCCWCQQEGSSLLLIPHPLSGYKIETFPCPDEAEVIGRVIAVAMRIAEGEKEHHARRELPKQL